MELPTLQTHCDLSGCKQLDFLPFSCGGCHRIFCLDHRTPTSHQCHVSFNREKSQCPLCGQFMNVSRDHDANEIIGRHIEAGCPKEEQLKSLRYPCTFGKCHNSEVSPIVCSACKGVYCLHHRQPDTHQCRSLSGQAAAAAASQTREAWWQQRFKDITSGLDVVRQKSNDPQAKQITMMKNKNKATGGRAIAEGERLYLEVVFPFERKIPSQWLYFNKNHPAGRALDEIAGAGKVKNENNKAGARKLVLIDLKTGDRVNLDTPLKSILDPGDVVMLEYEDGTKQGASN